jgi:hypothetical protein
MKSALLGIAEEVDQNRDVICLRGVSPLCESEFSVHTPASSLPALVLEREPCLQRRQSRFTECAQILGTRSPTYIIVATTFYGELILPSPSCAYDSSLRREGTIPRVRVNDKA